LIGTPEDERMLRRPKLRQEDNTKTDHSKIR
jgi:hypothetical protein